MKIGRINERNLGFLNLNGELKDRPGPKTKALPELTSEQENALNSAFTIKHLLNSHANGYYSYLRFDLSNSLIAHWFERGIITKGIRESKYAEKGFEPIDICILDESKIDDLKLVEGLLVSFFKLSLYIE